MDARDKKVLYLIQHRYGGTVKQISNALAFKYKLRNREGLIALINDVNGLIRNPSRLLQMNKPPQAPSLFQRERVHHSLQRVTLAYPWGVDNRLAGLGRTFRP